MLYLWIVRDFSIKGECLLFCSVYLVSLEADKWWNIVAMNRVVTVTAKLICAFVFAYANGWFSHAAAHLNFVVPLIICYYFHHYFSRIMRRHFCPPPFRRKAEGHSFWLSVIPSVLPSFRPSAPYRSMYLVQATPPTVLFRFFLNFTDVLTML